MGLAIAALDRAFLAALAKVPFLSGNGTCSGHASATGPAAIVPGLGTGGLMLTITAEDASAPARAGKCDATGAMLGQAIVTSGPSAVSLG